MHMRVEAGRNDQAFTFALSGMYVRLVSFCAIESRYSLYVAVSVLLRLFSLADEHSELGHTTHSDVGDLSECWLRYSASITL